MDASKELELFNAHQEDSRKRTEFLAKSVFLISGGALSLSVTLFLGEKAPSLTADLLCVLRSAWTALFASMAGYILVISTMLIRDYRSGERWRKALQGERVNAKNAPGWLDTLMWALGVLSVVSFLFGLGSLAYVSTALLKSSLAT